MRKVKRLLETILNSLGAAVVIAILIAWPRFI
jgi:hypothetical protein